MRQLLDLAFGAAVVSLVGWWIARVVKASRLERLSKEAAKRGDDDAMSRYQRERMAMTRAGRRWLRRMGLPDY
ncbi:MAG: hypothetical protein WD036_00520 [Bauldia sp.]